MKKLILLSLLFSVSFVFAQRSGGRAISTSFVSLSDTSLLVSAPSSLRMSETIVNPSGLNVWISFDSVATKKEGFMLVPYGGSLTYGAYTTLPWNGAVSILCGADTLAPAKADTITVTKTTIFIQ